MSSRLFQNVREKRGLAYAVFSGLSAYRDAGNITIYAGCANEAVGEVIDLCVEELRGMKQRAGARRRAAARQGSSQGQPDAEPREHRQPDVAPGAAGDLLRPPFRPRRDAGRRRARDRRRRAARRAAICSRTARWRRRCWVRRRRDDDARRSSTWDSTMIPRYTQSGDGRDLERPAPLRDLARGRARGGRRDGRGRHRARRRGARAAREGGASTSPASRRSKQITQHDVIAFTTAVAERVGPVGALAALRPDVVRRRRHRAGAADARGLRPHPQGHRRADGGRPRRAPRSIGARR